MSLSRKIEIAVLQFIYILICTIYLNSRIHIHSGSVPALEDCPAGWPGHGQHSQRQLLPPQGPGCGARRQPHLQPWRPALAKPVLEDCPQRRFRLEFNEGLKTTPIPSYSRTKQRNSKCQCQMQGISNHPQMINSVYSG